MGKSSLYIFYIQKYFKRSALYVILVFAIGTFFSSLNHTSLASYQHALREQFQQIREIVGNNIEERPRYTTTVVATAYSSRVEETDSTPCIAARGYDLCTADKENVIASNFLAIGTRVRFPDYNPDIVYTVVDTMNERFTDNRVDFWKKSKDKARSFGKQYLKMEVY